MRLRGLVAQHPKAQVSLRRAVEHRGRVEAHAVVGDVEHHGAVGDPAAHADLDRRGLGMADDIAQRLLGDPVEVAFVAVVEQRQRTGVEVDLDAQPAGPRPVVTPSLPTPTHGPGEMAESDWTPCSVTLTDGRRLGLQLHGFVLCHSRRKVFEARRRTCNRAAVRVAAGDAPAAVRDAVRSMMQSALDDMARAARGG